jgi:hypothetical protein
MVAASFRIFAGEDRPRGLGSGAPCLRIIWNAPNQYIVFNDLSYVKSWPGWPEKRPIQVLTERNFDIQTITEPCLEKQNELELYPFDEETAFFCCVPVWSFYDKTCDWPSYTFKTGGLPRHTCVFSINIANGEIILVSRDVYALARSRYGLTTNQLFLGKIGTNIFYFENRDVRKVYYHTTESRRLRITSSFRGTS